MTRQRLLRVSREVLLTTGAVLGVLCIAMTVVGFAFGVKPLMFRSGSMSPAIETGDLAFARTVDASMLHRGDIVSVVNSSGERITHRLVSAAEQGEARQLRLKGDANQSADAETYTATRADKVMFDLPRLGYVVNAASSPVGVFALGILVALVLVIACRKGPQGTDGADSEKPNKAGRRKATRHAPRRVGKPARVSVIVAFVMAATGVSGSASAAPWTDSVAVSGTSFAAGSVGVPATFTCGAVGLLSVKFTWSAVPGATDYTLHFGSGGADTHDVNGLTGTVTSAFSSGTAWVEANVEYGSTTWTSLASKTRSYSVAVFSQCG